MLLCFGVVSYASLGDGKKKKTATLRPLLAKPSHSFNAPFEFKPGYNFRGNTWLNPSQSRAFRMNTDVTVQVGNYAVSVPVRKTVFSNSPLKIQLGNRSLR